MISKYLAAQDLTHQMLEAARIQDWDTLTQIEKQRNKIVEETAQTKVPLPATEKLRVAEIITEIERESADIIERVECWQKHVKILLRFKEPVN